MTRVQYWLIAAACMLIPAAPAAADIIWFENEAGYYWSWSDLNITASSYDQPLDGPGSMISAAHSGGGNHCWTQYWWGEFWCWDGTAVARAVWQVTVFEEGDLIDGSHNWGEAAEWTYGTCQDDDETGDCICYEKTPFEWGVPAYVGLRFADADGETRYGWIQIVYKGWPQPLAWAYETEPDKPIIAGDTGECPADCDGNGALDLFDFLCFAAAFNDGDPAADCDGSGDLDLFDFLCFITAFNAGCP